MNPIFLYFCIIFIVIMLFFLRKETTVVRKKTILYINLFYFVVLTFSVFLFGIHPLFLVSFLLIGILPFLLGTRLLLFKNNTQETNDIIQKSLSMLIFTYEKINNTYVIKNQMHTITIHSHSFFPGFAILSIEETSSTQKANLLQKLIAKQFHGILPTITIHF